MKKLLDKLTGLINVKTIVTFAVTAVFIIQALQNGISVEVMAVTTMVLGFYFGTQHEKKK